MSRIVSITGSDSQHLVSYDSEYSAYSVSNLANAYADSTNTSYAQINLTRNANAVTQIFYNFDTLNIPSGATINSVSCTCKCSINTTTASRVATRQAQLYSGSTAMGTAYDVANSTTAFSITAGTWTAAQLANAKLRLYAVRGTSNTTTSYYFRLYGATLTVSYTLNTTAYTITASSSATGVTISPATQEIYSGESGTVTLNSNNNIVLTDNGNDVTSLIVEHQDAGTLEYIPNSVVENTFNADSSYPATNGLADSESTTYARLNLSPTERHIIYSFDTSAIPNDATITSVSCKVRAYVTSTSSSITTKTAQLYAGTTAKGSTTTIPTSNSVWNISNVGSWTASEIHNIRLRFDGYYSGSSTYYIRFYGADLTITYETDNYTYTYTISNINADHTILVSEASSNYIKLNDVFTKISKVYKKVSGSWVQQQELTSNLFTNVYFHEHYINYETEYLTFKALESGTFSFTTNDIEYSTNNGSTWTTLTAGNSTPTIAANSTIMWRASGLTPTSSAGLGTFSSTGEYEAMGNPLSLYYGSSFRENSTLVNYIFYNLFKNSTKLKNAKNLKLVASDVNTYAYSYMFYGCTFLIEPPELPATKLYSYAYSYMFYGCSSLTYAPSLVATSYSHFNYSYIVYAKSDDHA